MPKYISDISKHLAFLWSKFNLFFDSNRIGTGSKRLVILSCDIVDFFVRYWKTNPIYENAWKDAGIAAYIF